MTARNYQDCYQTLHAAQDYSWDQLRLAYRRRVRICHPDLQSPPDMADRDEEFKRVVRAYRLIARYRLQHGVLPPPALKINETRSVFRAPYSSTTDRDTAASDTFAADTSRSHTGCWQPLRMHVAVFAAFVSGIGTAAIVETLDEQRASEAVKSAERGQLSVGMDPEAVVRIQGVPNHTQGSVWYYGDSGVIFDRGCVVGWENQSPFPLRTLTAMAYLPGSIFEQDISRHSKQEDCLLPDS